VSGLAPASHSGARPQRRLKPVAFATWAVVVVLGFALVFTLGAPLASSNQQRADARAPLALPVTEESAVAAADELVRIDYPAYANDSRSVKHGTSQGEEIWTITYSRSNPVGGVRITVSGRTGAIDASLFP
jgi:hypothetical protein